MIGIAIQLLLSWVLLRVFERKDLTVLGFQPTKQRLQQFSVGLIIPIIYLDWYLLRWRTLAKPLSQE